MRLSVLATMFPGYHPSVFFPGGGGGVPEEYCAPGGTRNLGNLVTRSLWQFARFTQPNVWPRRPDAERCGVAK